MSHLSVFSVPERVTAVPQAGPSTPWAFPQPQTGTWPRGGARPAATTQSTAAQTGAREHTLLRRDIWGQEALLPPRAAGLPPRLPRQRLFGDTAHLSRFREILVPRAPFAPVSTAPKPLGVFPEALGFGPGTPHAGTFPVVSSGRGCGPAVPGVDSCWRQRSLM